MVEIEIGTNEKGQRFDRFLRKFLPGAPLSFIYRVIRKDAKVNRKREKNVYVLEEGDVVQLYLTEEDIEGFRKTEERSKPKIRFRVVYEDENILIVDKPAGLLTHGDRNEKRDHLTNQVQGYLITRGDFDPSEEKTFAPSPVNESRPVSASYDHTKPPSRTPEKLSGLSHSEASESAPRLMWEEG